MWGGAEVKDQRHTPFFKIDPFCAADAPGSARCPGHPQGRLMSDFPLNTAQQCKPAQLSDKFRPLPETEQPAGGEDLCPGKITERDFGPKIPDEKTCSNLPPTSCSDPFPPPQGTSVDPGPQERGELPKSLERLLSANFELPVLLPIAGIPIDPTLSTSLVPEETPISAPKESVLSWAPDVREVLEKTFRHGFWERRRWKTFLALENTEKSAQTLARFRDCGSKQWVMQDKNDPTNFRIKTNKCKNRWCEACNTEKRRTVCRNLKEQLPDGNLRMLTFTLKSQDTPLVHEIKRIYDSFRIWRKHAWFKDKIRGGIFFLEITYNHDKKMWHPHLHCIVDSEYLRQNEMRVLWKNITGDSFIVDVRKISNTEQAAGEVSKYATKAISGTIWKHETLLEEAILALRGRRTFQSFGTWGKLSLSRLPDDETEWVQIGTLAWFIQHAQRQQSYAINVLDSILGNRTHIPMESARPPPSLFPNI